jgi:hypothetical protein
VTAAVRRAVLALTAVGSLAFAREARADPTTWFSLGGGYGIEHDGAAGYDARATAFSVALGAGTSPVHPVVVGGVFRSLTFFTLGTDISLSARVATSSFARGDLGVAVDLGLAGRWWKGQDYGHFPVQGVAYLGLPYGFQVGVGGDAFDWTGDRPAARGGFALLEFDFLRLTVMRSGDTTKHWPNPSPAMGTPTGVPEGDGSP